MEYFKLLLGIGFTIVFTWAFFRNSKKSGFVPSLFSLETMIGLIAGIYIVIISINSLIF
jgi:hypothetical protein